MALSINQNIMAMNSYRNLTNTQSGLGKSLEKLSSGFRVNRAADDAAGLAISEGLRSLVRGNKQAVRNAQDGISVVQTAEGALNEVHDIIQRARELVIQAANDSNDSNARDDIKAELTELKSEVDRIAKTTEFNGQMLLDAENAATLNFQVGARGTENDRIQVTTVDISTVSSAIQAAIDVDTTDQENANASYRETLKNAAGDAGLDIALQTVSTARAQLGAIQNRFEHTINNLNVAVENLAASESRIRDTDMAQEMMNFTKNNILQQAGTAMLAQANQVPQAVLSLLR